MFEWNYDAIADRYGREILEREAGTVQLATEDHVQRFKQLLGQLSDTECKRLGIDRALTGVTDIADMLDERIVKGIELIESHLRQTATT